MTPDTRLIQQRKTGQICIVARTAVLSRQNTPWCATKRTISLSLDRQLWMKFIKR